MNTIWKHVILSLREATRNHICVPKGTKVLSAAAQRDTIVLYTLVDTDQGDLSETMEIPVVILGTGHPIELNGLRDFRLLGTFGIADDQLMWHVFVRHQDLADQVL